MLTPLCNQFNHDTQYLQVTSKPPEPPSVNTPVPPTTPTKTLSSMGQLWPGRTPCRLTKSHPDAELWHTHMLHRPSLRHLQTHGGPTTLPLLGLLFKSQHGFRKQHSTELAALELTERIRREMDQDKIPISVFLDLSKAFHILSHNILLLKLEYYGIEIIAIQWFKSYLTQRQQFVEYQKVCSSTRELETGVPQGSVLGPLLFLIYMNDIHTVSDKLNFILYADDTTLISPLCSFTHGAHNDVGHISSQINSESLKISDWLTVNKLSLNVEKTKFMVFHNY